MKQFIFRVVVFSTLSLTITLLLTFTLNILVQNEGFFKVNDGINAIVVGDSHAECAFNDKLIDNVQNFAQSGESYFYTYLKTKLLLEHNPSIKTVFIEFNNGQVIKNIDANAWEDKYMTSKYPKYVFTMTTSDYYLLAKNNLSGLLNSHAISITGNFKLVKEGKRSMHDLDWGKFKRLTNNGQDKLSKLDNLTLKMDTSVVEYAKTNLQYLHKLVDLCESEGVQAVFVRSPVHEKFVGRQNEITFNYLRKKHFENIPFKDYQDMKIENNEFADVHHLNFLGAEKFSKIFNEDLSSMEN